MIVYNAIVADILFLVPEWGTPTEGIIFMIVYNAIVADILFLVPEWATYWMNYFYDCL